MTILIPYEIKVEVAPGKSIADAAVNACDMAAKYNSRILFEFNKIKIIVTPTHTPADVVRYFNEALRNQW